MSNFIFAGKGSVYGKRMPWVQYKPKTQGLLGAENKNWTEVGTRFQGGKSLFYSSVQTSKLEIRWE